MQEPALAGPIPRCSRLWEFGEPLEAGYRGQHVAYRRHRLRDPRRVCRHKPKVELAVSVDAAERRDCCRVRVQHDHVVRRDRLGAVEVAPFATHLQVPHCAVRADDLNRLTGVHGEEPVLCVLQVREHLVVGGRRTRDDVHDVRFLAAEVRDAPHLCERAACAHVHGAAVERTRLDGNDIRDGGQR